MSFVGIANMTQCCRISCLQVSAGRQDRTLSTAAEPRWDAGASCDPILQVC